MNTATATKIDIMDMAAAERMTGQEKYSYLGTFFKPDIERATRDFCGLRRWADCVEKNRLVMAQLPVSSVLVAGSLHIFSGDLKSSYGYDYNPPLELHAFLIVGGSANGFIIDAALPGVIERGLNSYDEIGAYLVGRKPVILAGRPPRWLRYTPCEVVDYKIV